MKRTFTLSLLLILSFFVAFKIADAKTKSFAKGFGGRIIDEEAARITQLEGSGYTCPVNGDTFDITPYGKSPAGPYLAVKPPVTGGAAAVDKLTLGYYSSTPTIITCVNEDPYIPPVTVKLLNIIIFGVTEAESAGPLA